MFFLEGLFTETEYNIIELIKNNKLDINPRQNSFQDTDSPLMKNHFHEKKNVVSLILSSYSAN